MRDQSGRGSAVIVIYHAHGGNVAPAVCAWVHLGRFSDRRLPAARELVGLEPYSTRPPHSRGTITKLGTDRDGNDICYLSSRATFPVLQRSLAQVGRRLGVSTSDVIFVDTMPATNRLMRVGCVLAQTLRLGRVGGWLAAAGTRHAYEALKAVVSRTRARVAAARPPGVSTNDASCGDPSGWE